MPDGDAYASAEAEAKRQLETLYARFGKTTMDRIIAARMEAERSRKGRPPKTGDGLLLFEMYRVMATEGRKRKDAARLLTRDIENSNERIAVRRRLKNKFPEGLFEELKSADLSPGGVPTPYGFLAALITSVTNRASAFTLFKTSQEDVRKTRNLTSVMIDVMAAIEDAWAHSDLD